MKQIAHQNHFVSQFYLRQWSEDGTGIYRYDTLVPSATVPLWQKVSIEKNAVFQDLYTSTQSGLENDDFERWIKRDFEDPAKPALDKVINNKSLTQDDINRLVLFLALQDVRTPTAYGESAKRWKNTFPKLLENTMKLSVKKLEKMKGKKIHRKAKDKHRFSLDGLINTTIVRDENGAYLKTELLAGRELWLRQQRHLLTGIAKYLLQQKWSIFYPCNGVEWFTSDHPVVRLNYYSNGNFDIRGGWGNKNGNVFMPLSPKHLLFTQIDFPETKLYESISVEETMQLQNILAQRAYKWIYAQKPLKEVEYLRPRLVDKEAFNKDLEQQRNWHKNQSNT